MVRLPDELRFTGTRGTCAVPPFPSDLPPGRRLCAYLGDGGGQRVLQRLLVDDPLPRATVCGSDATASGAVGAPRANGLRVRDVAVTSFNVMFPAASVLASVSLRSGRIATLAVGQVIRRIEGCGGPARHFIEPFSIQVGTSCGCPPSGAGPGSAPRAAPSGELAQEGA